MTIPASQCALHIATLAAQWWGSAMLVPAVRRAWYALGAEPQRRWGRHNLKVVSGVGGGHQGRHECVRKRLLFATPRRAACVAGWRVAAACTGVVLIAAVVFPASLRILCRA